MVCSLGLGNKTLVALNEGILWILDLPLADVAEGLTANRSLLGGFRGRPALGPVLGELLEERSLDRRGLQSIVSSVCAGNYVSEFATCLEHGLGGVLGVGRAGGGDDEESGKRYASHCVRRTVTGVENRMKARERMDVVE